MPGEGRARRVDLHRRSAVSDRGGTAGHACEKWTSYHPSSTHEVHICRECLHDCDVTAAAALACECRCHQVFQFVMAGYVA